MSTKSRPPVSPLLRLFRHFLITSSSSALKCCKVKLWRCLTVARWPPSDLGHLPSEGVVRMQLMLAAAQISVLATLVLILMLCRCRGSDSVSVCDERHPLTNHNNSPVISHANRCSVKRHKERLRHATCIKHEFELMHT